MRPAKKNLTKALSVLSMAAAAAMATQAAHAATLTLYYGDNVNPATYAAANPYVRNGIYVSSTTNFGSAAATQQTTGINTGSPMTINMPVNDYLSLAIDAVLTNNTNPDGGYSSASTTGGAEPTQPTNLGLGSLSISVNSTDTGVKLAPLAVGAKPAGSAGTTPYTTYNGTPEYNSVAIVNNNLRGGSNGTGVNDAGGNGIVPVWSAVLAPGDVYVGNGGVGVQFPMGGGTLSASSSSINELSQFAASTASYANATVAVDTIQFEALAAGTVTLQPVANSSGTDYWYLSAAGTANTQSQYAQAKVDTSIAGNTINPMQELVIVIGGGSTAHSIVSLISGTTAGANYGSNVGSIAMVGGNGAYSLQQITGLSDTTDSLAVSNWNPVTDKEIFGVDVLVGGSQANTAQLATLMNAIGGTDSIAPASTVTASTTDPTGGVFPAGYNLFLTFTGGELQGSPDDLGLDLSNTNDSLLTGYTFSKIAVVPEPMSLGLLALGGVGLMARRNRRKA